MNRSLAQVCAARPTGPVGGGLLRGLCVLLAYAATHACAPGPRLAEGDPSLLAPDSLRGTVLLVGPAATSELMLRVGSDPPSVRLTGEHLPALRRVVGTEVTVRGTPVERLGGLTLEVEGFRVDAVDGVPALDGRLLREGAGYVLVSEDGVRTPVRNVPLGLDELAGARVWITGPVEREPTAWGVIEPAGS